MNKLYRLPLRMRSKPQQLDTRRRRTSPNLILGGILAAGALFAVAALGLTFFGAFRHKPNVPKEVGVVTPAPAVANVSPEATPAKEDDAVMPLTNPNAASTPKNPNGASTPNLASARLTNDQLTSVPASSGTPIRSSTPAAILSSTPAAASPASTVQKHEQKTETDAGSSEKSLSKAARMSLEKKRVDAERKRARLEQMYQNHEISADVYNKGEEEYKSEIKKYRNELKSGG
jgi:hypothetical protein